MKITSGTGQSFVQMDSNKYINKLYKGYLASAKNSESGKLDCL
jgi:hypothetical protein